MRSSWFVACLMVLSLGAAAKADNLTHAVQDAARSYRIQIYETFRTDRTTYDQRRAVADMLLDHWQQAGSPEPWSEELVQWFAEARSASTTANGQLPELPQLLPVEPNQPPADEVQAFVPAEQPVVADSEAQPAAEPTAEAQPLTAPADARPASAEPAQSLEGAAAPADGAPAATTNSAWKALGSAFLKTVGR